MSPDVRWEVPQTHRHGRSASPRITIRSRAYAKTLQRDGKTWGGGVPADPGERRMKLAHDNSAMDCQICHTSWATSCFGCHLPMKANQRVPQNKFEGVIDRNYTTYNPQVVRDDVFMLGIDGTVKKNRMAVIPFLERGGGQFAECRIANGFIRSSRRSPPKATAARRSIRISRTPRAASARRRIAPTAISRRTTTTTPG